MAGNGPDRQFGPAGYDDDYGGDVPADMVFLNPARRRGGPVVLPIVPAVSSSRVTPSVPLSTSSSSAQEAPSLGQSSSNGHADISKPFDVRRRVVISPSTTTVDGFPPSPVDPYQTDTGSSYSPSSESSSSSLSSGPGTPLHGDSVNSSRRNFNVKRNLFSGPSHTVTSGAFREDESVSHLERSPVAKNLTPADATHPPAVSSCPQQHIAAMLIQKLEKSYSLTVIKTLHADKYIATFSESSGQPGERIAFLIPADRHRAHLCKKERKGVVPVVLCQTGTDDSVKVTVTASYCLPAGKLTGYAIESNGIIVPMLYESASPDFNYKCKRHYCLFCSNMVTAMGRHLLTVHKHEERVMPIALLPINSAERHRLLDEIRKEGNLRHNASALPEKRIPLKIPTKTRIADMVACPNCGSVVARRTFYRHDIRCTKRETNRDRKKECLRDLRKREEDKRRVETSSVWDDATEELLRDLNDDEVARAIKSDECIMLMAKRFAWKYRSEVHHYKNGRQHLRLAAKILLRCKARDPSITCFYDALKNDKYKLILAVVDEDIMEYEPESRTYKKPSYSNVVRLVLNELDAAARTEMSMKGIHNDDPAYKDLDQFRFLHTNQYGQHITKTANVTTKRRHMRRKVELPTTNDITIFTKFLSDVAASSYDDLVTNGLNIATWRSLNAAIMIKTMIFNRRRPGEVSRARLEDWNLRSAICDDDKKHMNRLDILTAETYLRMQILGKRDRRLPLLIKIAEEKWIIKLIELRSDAGVEKQNPYLFANGSKDSYFQLNPLIRKYANQCRNLEFPQRMRGTLLRKQIATQAQYLNLSESELRMVAAAMGHDLAVHMQVYRQPELNNDILLLGKYFEFVGDSNLALHKGKTIEQLKDVLGTDKNGLHDKQDSSGDDGDDKDDVQDDVYENGSHLNDEPLIKKRRIETPCSTKPPVLVVSLPRLTTAAIEKYKQDARKQGAADATRNNPTTPDKTKQSKMDLVRSVFNTPRGKGRRGKLGFTREQRDIMFEKFGTLLKKGLLPKPSECEDLIENHRTVFISMEDRNVSRMYSFLQFRRNTINRFLKGPR